MKAILAIESSCDETAVAVVAESGVVVAEALESQIKIHQTYGGVVPEVASRQHFEVIDRLARRCLESAPEIELQAVAATCGPGLIGPLLVGACYGQGFARGRHVPFIGVHHLRGHLASALLGTEASGATLRERAQNMFPAAVLLVSGGHTQILEVQPGLHVRKLADTADDAAGECFDKAAKLMGLPYPGGPAIEKLAAELIDADRGRAAELRDRLPKPRSEVGFSFSGLKTAFRLMLEKEPALSGTPMLAWALQERIAGTLLAGLERAFRDQELPPRVLLCGGVAANRRLREVLSKWVQARGAEVGFPPLKYSTDNAAMIAAAAWVQAPQLASSDVAARVELETA